MKLRSQVGMEAWGVWQSEFSIAHWITTTTTGRDLAANRWQACKWCRLVVMSTLLHNKTISKTTPLGKENPFPQFNVASHKRPGIRLSFEYTTTLLSGEGGEGRTGTATMFRKMLSKYTIFSTVLSKIVATVIFSHVKITCYFFLSLRAGGILQILQSDWFRERAVFYDLAC